jgi:cation:H+ antiporter
MIKKIHAGVKDAMHPAWFVFLLSALLIYLAGTRLTTSASNIARETGLGGLWVGLIILPLSTSLPELVSSWRAVSIGAPDLAVGNFLGSNLVNIAMIALVDLVQGKGALFKHISSRHKTTVLFVASMTLLVILGMLLPEFSLGISPITPLLFVAYLAVGRFMLKSGSVEPGEAKTIRNNGILYRALVTYILSSVVIILAAVNLADAAETLAEVTGFGRTFVGSFLLAVSTSLPEMVTTTTAARMGALDMAVGNILGANLFNLALLFPVDLFYREGGLLSALSPLHFITALMGIFLAALVYLGLARPSRVLLGDVGLNSLFIAALYIFSIVLLFLFA